MSDHEEEAGDEGLDDEERAFQHAEEDRDKEQDDADNDVAPGPAEDE